MTNKELREQIDLLIRAGNLTQEQTEKLKQMQAALRKTQKAVEDTEDTFSDFQEGMNDIGEGFGLRLGNMFKQIEVEVEQVSRDISTIFSDLQANAPDIAQNIAEEFNSSFRNALPDPKDIQAQINLNSLINEFKSTFPEMGDEMRKAFKTGDIASFYKKFGDEGMANLQRFMKDKKGFDGLKEYFKPGGGGEKGLENFKANIRELEPVMTQVVKKTTFEWKKLFKGIGDNLLDYIGFRQLLKTLTEFDDNLSTIKKEFQLPTESFGKASVAMRDMVVKGAQFGLTTEQSFGLVKKLGEEARSTNVQNLSETAQALAAIPQATGIAVDAVGDIAGKMMFFGAGAERARDAFVKISQNSARFGVNVTKVAKQFQDNFPRYARMGFKGGEESLAKMAAKAEKMGMELGKALDMSDKFIDINEAIEASADLSLLGGAAAQVSFIDLMRAAQEGGDALLDITNKMTSDIGKLNAKGELQLTLIDRQRIAGIAKATNQDVETLTNQLNARLQDSAKKAMIPPNLFNSLSDEEKEFLLSKVVRDKSGKFKLEGLDGIKDLSSLAGMQKGNITEMLTKSKKDAEQMEKQAEARRSLNESFTAATDTIKAMIVSLQPLLTRLSQVINFSMDVMRSISKAITGIFGVEAGRWVKAIGVLVGVLMLTLAPSAIGKLALGLLKALNPVNLAKKIGGLFGAKGIKPTDVIPKVSGVPDVATGGGKVGKKGPTMLQQFAKISPAQLLGLAAAIVALGAAFMLIGKGIEFAANGLSNLVKAFKDTQNAGMALGAVTVVMGAFVGMMALMIPIVKALGTTGMQAAPGLIALGIALVGMGYGIKLASEGLAVLVGAFDKTKNAGMALAAVTVVVGGFVAALMTIAFGGPAVAAGIQAVAMGMSSAIGTLGTAFTAFAVAMAVPTPIGPVGLVVAAMAIAIGAALYLAAPAFTALGNLLTGLGNAFKGLAPLVVAAGNAISMIVKSIGEAVTKVLKVAFDFVRDLVNVNPLKLYAVAGGLGAISLALAGFGGGSLLAGLGAGIGKFFGGDPIKKLKAFASIDGNNLEKIGNSIKSLAGSLKSLESVSLGNFLKQMDKLKDFSTDGVEKIAGISKSIPLIRTSINALAEISRLLTALPPVELSKINALSNAIEIITTKIKPGLDSLALAALSSQVAKFTVKALIQVAKDFNTVPVVRSEPFLSLSNIVTKFLPPIIDGLSKLGKSIINIQLAKMSASRIASVAASLNSVPDIKTGPFISLAKVLNDTMTPIKNGLNVLSGLLIQSQLARPAASGLASIAKNLSSVPQISPGPFLALAKVLSGTMDQIKQGLSKLTSITVDAQLARIAASGLAKVSQSLNSIPVIKTAAFDNLNLILSDKIPGITKGIDLLGKSIVNSKLAVFTTNAIVTISKSLLLVKDVKPISFNNLSKIFNLYIPQIVKGIRDLSSVTLSSLLAIPTAEAIKKIAEAFIKVPDVNVKNFEGLSNIFGPIMNNIVNGLKKLGSIPITSQIARITANGLKNVALSLNEIPTVKIQPFTALSQIFTTYLVEISNGLVRLRNVTFSSQIARIAANGIKNVALSLGTVPSIKTTAFESLAKVLGSLMSTITSGISKMSAGAIDSQAARITANGIKNVALSLNSVPTVNVSAFQVLSTIFSTIMGNIIQGIQKMSGSAVNAQAARITANGIKNVVDSLKTVTNLNVAIFQNLATVFGTPINNIIKGISNLGGLGGAFDAQTARISANGIVAVANTLKQTPLVNTVVFDNLSKIFSVYMKNITNGLSRMKDYIISFEIGEVTSKSLVKIGKILSSMPAINITNFISLSSVLGPILEKIKVGLTNLSSIGFTSLGAALVAKQLANVGKSFSQIPLINVANINSLASGIDTIANKIKPALDKLKDLSITGLLKLTSFNMFLSLAGSSLASAIQSSKSLLQLAQNISLIPVINQNNLINLANAIKSGTNGLIQGIIKFAVVNLFIDPAITTSKKLLNFSTILNSIPVVASTSLNSLNNVLNQTSIGLLTSLAKFMTLSAVILPSLLVAKGLLKLATTLIQIPVVQTTPILQLTTGLKNIGNDLVSGLFNLTKSSPFIIPAILVSEGLARIFKNFAPLTKIDLSGLKNSVGSIGSVGKFINEIANFSLKGSIAGIFSGGLTSLSKSLQQSVGGFIAFSKVPWSSLGTALPVLTSLSTIISGIGSKGLLAGVGVSAMAGGFSILGKSLSFLSSKFGDSTKSMADYNKEKDKLKTVATAPRPVASSELTAMQKIKSSAVFGTEISVGKKENVVGTNKETGNVQVVQIKPIQIDLKLNGRQLQQIIVEANYNRS